MGESQLLGGVRIRNSSIAIRFQFLGKRHEETWKVKPTPANLKRAAKMRRDICADIRAGVFRIEEYFPDSRHARSNEHSKDIEVPTFREVADSYLKSLTVADSTMREYRNGLSRYFYTNLGLMKIDEISYSHLVNVLSEIDWKSNKTRNNAIGPLRGVFQYAEDDQLISFNPASRLKFAKFQRKEPDPLNLEEVELVLSWLLKNEHEVLVNYFQFAFFSGLRSSEQLAISWKDIDWLRGTVRVQRARVEGKLKETKTYVARDIKLNSRSLEALKRQKKHSFLRNEEIFINPNTDTPFITNKAIRNVWNHCLKKIGIRHRVSYQTRHTFCTLNLISGANIMWVSKQMGHSNTQMTLTRYAKWVEMPDQKSETSKLDVFVSKNGGNESILKLKNKKP